MATLVLGPDGEQTCEPCAYGFCSSRGHICETDGCECYCKVRPLTTEHFDTAPTLSRKTFNPQEVDKETAAQRTTRV